VAAKSGWNRNPDYLKNFKKRGDAMRILLEAVSQVFPTCCFSRSWKMQKGLMKPLLLALLLSGAIFSGPSVEAFEEKLETYYPAPYGEYKDLVASDKMVIPVKETGAEPINNEIWVEEA
jgi:hypothetical protein